MSQPYEELSREKFEKHATSGNWSEMPFLLEKDEYGQYIAGETEDVWEFWLAAWQAASPTEAQREQAARQITRFTGEEWYEEVLQILRDTIGNGK